MIRRRALAIAVSAVVGQGAPAAADTPRATPAAIEIDRDVTPAGRVGFGFDGGELVERWGVSLAASWLERPIELAGGTLTDGSPATRPVARRQTLALGGALALGDRAVLEATLRTSHQIGDRLRAAGDPEALARFVLHDVRLAARLRVAGDDDGAVLLRGELTLPSGNAGQFAGDARWTAAWSLIGRATLGGGTVLAATTGIRLAGAEVAVGDRIVGNALFAAAGAAVPLGSSSVAVTGELAGALGDSVAMRAGPNPLEARLGVIVQPLVELRLAARLGVGLDDQLGAPRLRAMLELAWAPRSARGSAAPSGREPPPDELPAAPDDDDADAP